MSATPGDARRRREWLTGVAAFAVLVLVTWLDADRCLVVNQAGFFAAIWTGIKFIAEVIGIVGSAVASSLEGVVAYLVSAVSWLSGRVADILVSTGAIFAKTWDAIRILWSNVLQPALQWLDAAIRRVQTWLKDTFGPVFKWLQRVRDELNKIYTKFVKPVVDTIEFVRQINRVLLTFHITLLQKLDAYLAELERRIREPILWLYARLSEVQNAVDFMLTGAGFFQRYALVRSLGRYAPDWIRQWWESQTGPIDADALAAAKARTVASTPASAYSEQLGAFYRDGTGDYAADIAALVDVWKDAAGVLAS